MSRRHVEIERPEETELRRRMVGLASEHGRCGNRRIISLLWADKRVVDDTLMDPIYREKGLKLP